MSENVPTAVTIGTFDGVHLGHQQILEQLKRIAKSHDLKPTVITFDPHPQEVLRTKKPDIHILTDIGEKTAIFLKIGIPRLVVIDFNKELSNLSPRTFVEEVFIKRLKAQWVVIGYDHAFGKDREGNRDNLATLSNQLKYQVTVVDPVDVDGTIISSTKIRKALYIGNVALAKAYLGSPYSISGKVIPGDSRGRALQIPTANIRPSHPCKLIPADAVYAGHAVVGPEIYLAAISIGDRPTFKTGDRVLEAHLLDFDGDLYNKTIKVQFDRKIRDQITFSTDNDLIDQIKTDIKTIKDMTAVSNQAV